MRSMQGGFEYTNKDGNKVRLTKRQHEVFNFIMENIRSRGYGPTVREIGLAFGIKSPNGVICHLMALVKKGMISREPNLSRAISLLRQVDRAPGLPLAGVIAAGKPMETPEQPERIDFADFFSRPGFFALKVRGNSMIDDYINDGDYVVVKKQSTARDGQIVVALVDGQDTTLKRFYKEKGRFRLEPANANMQPIYCKKLDIMGIVAGVVRMYGSR